MEKQLTTAQIKEIIKGRPASEIDLIINEYIHDTRNREIAKAKLLQNMPYEPLSEIHRLTPRQCFNIVSKSCRIIIQHIDF